MPFQELIPPPRSAEQQRLLKELVAELRHPRPAGQPRVVVKQVGKNRVRHVYVFWDRWEGCPAPIRGDIAYDALAEVMGKDYEESIALVVTATIPEATELGLLPYQVRYRGWSNPESELSKRCNEAMLALGASVLRSPKAPELRFESEEEAEKAVEQLRAAVPEAEWGVTVTVLTPGEQAV
jgi:hypothetical protein